MSPFCTPDNPDMSGVKVDFVVRPEMQNRRSQHKLLTRGCEDSTPLPQTCLGLSGVKRNCREDHTHCCPRHNDDTCADGPGCCANCAVSGELEATTTEEAVDA